MKANKNQNCHSLRSFGRAKSARPFGGRYMHVKPIVFLFALTLFSSVVNASHYLVYQTADISKTFQLGIEKGSVTLKKSAKKTAELYFHKFDKRVALELKEIELLENIKFSSGVLAKSSENENSLFVLFDCTAKGSVIFEIKEFTVLDITNEECEGI